MTRGQQEEEIKASKQAPAADTPSLPSAPLGHVTSRVTQCCCKYEYASSNYAADIQGHTADLRTQLQPTGMETLSMAGREVWRRPPNPALQQPR